MSIPAIIVLVLWGLSLIIVICKDGQPQEDHSFSSSLASVLIMGILLYWGGFFNV